MLKYNITRDELIQKYINENYTIDQCVEYFGCGSRHPIVDMIKKYGIHKTLSHQTIMKMSDEMYDVLRGALLGDGSLIISKNSVNAYFCYNSKSLQHVQFVGKYFDEYKSGKGIYSYVRFDKRTGKSYNQNLFVTNRSVTLTEERNKWYIDGIKHIPNDLVLTPLMCLVWYIGDGGISNYKNRNCQAITLATNCFKKEEPENIILPQLSQFEAKIAKNGLGKDGSYHYQIKIYKKENIIKFLNYIGDCPFDDYSYKWDIKPSLLKNHEQYVKEYIELYNLNFPTTKIGLLYNCSRTTITRYLKSNGIEISDARNKGFFPPSMEWENLYNNGKSIDEIADIYKCSPLIVNRYFDYIKIHGNDEFLFYNKKKTA